MVVIEVPKAGGPTSREGEARVAQTYTLFPFLPSLSLSLSFFRSSSLPPPDRLSLFIVCINVSAPPAKKEGRIKPQPVSARENYLRPSRENKPDRVRKRERVLSCRAFYTYINRAADTYKHLIVPGNARDIRRSIRGTAVFTVYLAE